LLGALQAAGRAAEAQRVRKALHKA
jgi:hypothetical protein